MQSLTWEILMSWILNRRFFSFVFALTLIGVVSTTSHAASGPEEFINKLGSEALAIMKGDPNPSVRAQKLAQIFRTGLDLQTIGRFALGAAWNQATPAQRQEYQQVFESVVVKNYSRLWSLETPLSFSIISQQPISERDTLVTTEVTRQGKQPLRLSWRVRTKPEGHQIIDVVVDGLSLITTQRDEFSAAVSQKGIDGLISLLKERNAQL